MKSTESAPVGPVRAPAGPVEATDPHVHTPSPAVRRSLPARLVTVLIRAYQLVRIGRVSPCRFTPTCSQYAVEAVERHGAGRGLALAARRLGRCRPGGPSGYDPVPE